MPVQKPSRPQPRTEAARRIFGRYKVEPADFVVEEIPAYLPSGRGDHLYLWIEKRGLSTIDLLRELGACLGVRDRAFGVAGLKDAQAVSRQWVSLEHADEAACRAIEHERFSILRAERHTNKLRLGHLRGNRFEVLLRQCAATDLPLVRDNLAELTRLGVPNYFGEQRFGKRGANLQKGLDVLRGNPAAFARRMPHRVFGLVLSAVQSEVFNRVVAARLQHLDRLLPGDLAFLHHKGAVFAVDDPATEQPRADALEISPSGPLPGPDMTEPEGEPLAIERAALAELELPEDAFAELPFGLGRGARRPLRIPIDDAGAEAADDGIRVRFALPRGSYATAVLRELLTDTIWFQQ